MLKSLHIQNYILINRLDVDFDNGLTIITGETGAGKSILLGALGMILGQRADTSSLYDKNSKCIIEGRFGIQEYNLKPFFDMHDLDYEEIAIIRREIAANGKSRAFINDTPVTLTQLKELCSNLVDIHSQHQSLNLGDHKFQLSVLDSFCKNQKKLETYRENFNRYKKLIARRNELQQMADKGKADLDYYQFQYNQLEEAKLQEGETDELEIQQRVLENAEEIKTALSQTAHILDGAEGENTISSIKQCIGLLQKIESYLPAAEELVKRFNSILIESRDLLDECSSLAEDTEIDSGKLEEINERLDLIYTLQQKHNAGTLIELLELQKDFHNKIQQIESFDDELIEVIKELDIHTITLQNLAADLEKERRNQAPAMEKKIHEMLGALGMAKSVFSVQISIEEDFNESGLNTVSFLFSANPDLEPQEISKAASGGELSRLMLSIKSLLVHSGKIPTIIFDEIDSGVSGEIAGKMGNIMKEISKNAQLISITHLPQIAGKGDSHFVVYKKEENNKTSTSLVKLSQEERIAEIARMLSGEGISNAAIENAQELLKN